MHDKAAAGRLDAFDIRSVNLKLSGELRAGDLRVDIRCDAVTEDAPSRGILAGEGEPLFPREMAPDALRMGAQFIHNDRRIRVPFIQKRAMLLHHRDQLLLTELSEVQARGREVWILDATKVRMGEPTVAGDGMDTAHPAQRTQ